MDAELKRRMKQKMDLQKAKNIVSCIRGISVIDFFESSGILDWDKLRELGYYSNDKIPQSKITMQSSDDEVVDWIINEISIKNNCIIYVLIGNFLVKINIENIEMSIHDLWIKCNGFSFVDEDLKVIYDFGSDSRDEYNYLYDRYELR